MNEKPETFFTKEDLGCDQDTFAEMYELNVSSIYKFVLCRVEDQGTAEDITSVVFLKAWEKLSTFKDRGVPFKAWLFRIARNTVIDHYRTRKEVTAIDAISEQEIPLTEPLSDDVGKTLELESLMLLVNQLTPDQQQVIILKLVLGLKNFETAEQLRKNEGAVRALQMRGLQRLRTIFESSTAGVEFAEAT